MSCRKMKTKLFVHIVPTPRFDNDILKFDIDKKVLYVRHLYDFHSSINRKSEPKFWCFKTDGIFWNTPQNEVYSAIMDRIIHHKSLGRDYLILSCGQNCSGKSYTMSGLHNRYELRGIVPRFVVGLFDKLESVKEDFESHVSMSVIDIYKNNIYDLLSEPGRRCKDVKSVKYVSVASEMKCLKLLFKAEKQRITMENKSYNSHVGSSIVTFIVKLDSLKNIEPLIRFKKVAFVDLAGIETINRNPSTSFKDKESQADANVTKTLVELFAMHSKLNLKTNPLTKNNHMITKFLDHSLSYFSSKTVICHLRPMREDLSITLSVMKFGNIFRGTASGIQREKNDLDQVRTESILTLTVNMLEDELTKVNVKKQKTHQKRDTLSEESERLVENAVMSFISDEITGSELLDLVKDDDLVIKIMKQIHCTPPPKASAIIQTDSASSLRSTIRPTVNGQESNISEKPAETEEATPSVRRKSLISQAKSNKNSKTKSKPIVKPDLRSEEVQVNLVDSQESLPDLESREGLWARFIIDRLEIQETLDELKAVVSDTEKKLNSENEMFDNIKSLIFESEIALKRLQRHRNMEEADPNADGAYYVGHEKEIELLENFKQLQQELEVKKEDKLYALLEWLEALEKLDREKRKADEEFKEFCIQNNVPIFEQQTAAEDESSTISGEYTTDDDDFRYKQVYETLQKEYLKIDFDLRNM